MRYLLICALAGCAPLDPAPVAADGGGPGERVGVTRPDLVQPSDAGTAPDLVSRPDLAQAPDLVQLPDLTQAPDLLVCSPLGTFCSSPCCAGDCQLSAGGGATCCRHLGSACASDADCCADTGAGAPTHCYPWGQGGRCCYVVNGATICN